MPKITPYTQQINFDSGIRQETPRAGAQEVSHGLSNLGSTIENIGGDIGHVAGVIQDVQSREEVTGAQTEMVVAHAKLSMRLAQMETEADPKDRTLPDRFNKEVGDYFDKLDPRYETRRGAEVFQAGARRLTADMAAEVSFADARLAAKSATIEYTTMVNTLRNTVLLNPSFLHDKRQQAEDILKEPDGLYARMPGAAKQTMIVETNRALYLSAAQGEIRLDPQEGLAKLKAGYFSKYLDADATNTLINHAEMAIHAQTAGRNADHMRQAWEDEQQVKGAEAKLYSQFAKHKLTIPNILNATTESGESFMERAPEKGLSLVNMVETQARGLIDKVQTNLDVKYDLYRRIHAPEGQRDKLSDESAITTAYLARQIDDGTQTFLRKEFDESRTVAGQKLGERKMHLFNAVKPVLDKSILGKIDDGGGLRVDAWQYAADEKIQEYQAAKKSLAPLFNPKSAEYLGSREFIHQFETKWQDQMQQHMNKFNSADGPPPPPRQGDEDYQTYRKRIGGAVTYDSNFNTILTPVDEANYEQWKKKYAPSDSGKDYDLRGAFKAGIVPDKNGHMTDVFKKPNHPTFSDESQYAKFGKPGHWKKDLFVPAGR